MHAGLLAFGFVWMIVATLIGMVLGARHDNHLKELRQCANGGDLVAYNERTEAFQAWTTAHAHSFLFSVILVLVAMIVTRLPFPPVINRYIPYALMCSTILWTVAALKVVRPLMIAADLVFLLALSTIAVGLVMRASF